MSISIEDKDSRSAEGGDRLRDMAEVGQHPCLKVTVHVVVDQKQSTAVVATQTLIDRLRDKVSAPFTAAFMAGGVAGAVSRTVVSPLERLKILYQIQTVGRDEYKLSIVKALKKMYTDEGWRGFMRGNGTNCIRIIPYSAVQFGSYNLYKRVCGA